MMDTLSLLILSDDRLTRAGLSAVLAESPRLMVVGESDGQADLADLLNLYAPDVLLWDLGWEPDQGVQGQPAPLAQLAAAVELAIPTVALLPDVSYATAVWHTGIAGLLPRSARLTALVAAVEAAAADLRVLDPRFAAEIVLPQSTDMLILSEPITPREEDVLKLLAEGLTNRAIGRALNISEHTAKFHVQALMGKLGAQSRTEAVVRATRMGLLTL
ncbi:MAG: response regulator transcription factor [Caldilineaceae bacterium]|nr:response regulator transcription factor [Caldilineaceae bacterium]